MSFSIKTALVISATALGMIHTSSAVMAQETTNVSVGVRVKVVAPRSDCDPFYGCGQVRAPARPSWERTDERVIERHREIEY